MQRVLMIFAAAAGLAGLALSSLTPSPAMAEASHDPAEWIRAAADAYKRAPAFTDQMDVAIKQRGATGNDTVLIRLGSGKDAEVEMQGFVFTSAGSDVYIHQRRLPAKYIHAPLDTNLMKTLEPMTGGPLPAPQAAMRFSDDPNVHLQSLGMGIVRNLKIEDHSVAESSGRWVIDLVGDQGGTVKAVIDPSTMFLTKIDVSVGTANYAFTMSPKVAETLETPIAFATTGKRQVPDLSQLRLTEGDPAPDFELETSTGKTVTLADLRGSVVVLDFWATWCGPCKRGLPGLAKLQSWADSEGQAVRVLGVNTGEHQPTPEKKREHVHGWWTAQNFPMPTLMDYDAVVARAYEVGPIPHTVVIGPDGTILKIKIGFDPNAESTLKKVALDALTSAG